MSLGCGVRVALSLSLLIKDDRGKEWMERGVDEERGKEEGNEGAEGIDGKEVEVGVREQRGARSWKGRDGRREGDEDSGLAGKAG